MRGIIVKFAIVPVLAAVAAQAASAQHFTSAACEPPTMTNVSWTWMPNGVGLAKEREILVHYTLNARGSRGGTLYLKLNSSDPNTNDGNVGEAFAIDSSTDEIGSFGDELWLGHTYHFSITYWNGCVGPQLKYGLLVSFTATVGVPGSLAPKVKQPTGTAVCTPYYVIDSRGSGVADHVLSGPGAEFVRRLKAKKGSQAVYAAINPYPAVGVIPTLTMLKQSWSLSWRDFVAEWQMFAASMNGIGASIHSKWIGAYRDSLREGEADLRNLINSEVAKCDADTTKILLVGYSQGAQVAANVYQTLDPGTRQRIAGVVLFGDPKYNHLALAADAYPRDNNGILDARGFFPPDSRGKVLSFCHARDPVCQGWGQFLLHRWGAHLNYDRLGEPQLAANYFATG